MTDRDAAHDDELELLREQRSLLQQQVDRLHDRNRALRQRIERLERDREALRQRLAARSLRSKAAALVRRTKAASMAETTPAEMSLDNAESPAQPARPDLHVATILDEFSDACLRFEFRRTPVTPGDWRTHLESDPPDLLFVESAFRGNRDAWANEIAGFRPPRPELEALVLWCKKQSIPTVFWNKEDPINFDWFIGAASAFDWVFTVDEASIPRYRQALGHRNVGVLPFAAQPAIHHPPVDPRERNRGVAFAGTYYAAKHTERRRQIDFIVRPALDFGLDIYDRMGGNDERYRWPEEYRSAIKGSLSYGEMIEMYRRYRVFLNVNTVTNSPTMCARRIFELAASGAAVLSGPALAIERMVPTGAITVSTSATETQSALRRLLDDDDQRAAQTEAARSWVLEAHTYAHRVEHLLAHLDGRPA